MISALPRFTLSPALILLLPKGGSLEPLINVPLCSDTSSIYKFPFSNENLACLLETAGSLIGKPQEEPGV